MNERVTNALRRGAHVVLAVVALVGVVLSWASLYEAARPTFGPVLAAGFPLLADMLAAGASLMFVSGARQGQGRAGWRVTAHAAIAGTVALNALAAPTVGDVPWHVTAPAVWAVLVELYGREALGEWKAEHVAPKERIPGRLWLTAPIESARTWLRQGRTGILEHAAARLDVGLHAAAGEALRLALPDRAGRRVRRVLARQLRAGSMPPAAVLAAIGWTGEPVDCTPEAVLRAALSGVLAEDEQVPVEPVTTTTSPPTADGEPAPVETPRAAPLPAATPVRRQPSRRKSAPAGRVSDADLLVRVTASVEAGEFGPGDVTGNRLRALLEVGAERAGRLAETWTEQHRRATVRQLRTAAAGD